MHDMITALTFVAMVMGPAAVIALRKSGRNATDSVIPIAPKPQVQTAKNENVLAA